MLNRRVSPLVRSRIASVRLVWPAIEFALVDVTVMVLAAVSTGMISPKPPASRETHNRFNAKILSSRRRWPCFDITKRFQFGEYKWLQRQGSNLQLSG